MNKTLRHNGAEVTVNWMSSKTRKKIVEIFGRAEKDCRAITSEGFSGSIDEMERVETVYRKAFEELFGKEKCDQLFPDETGVDEYFEFINAMVLLKDEQEKALDKSSQKFAAMTQVK